MREPRVLLDKNLGRAEIITRLRALEFTEDHDWRRKVTIDKTVRNMIVRALTSPQAEVEERKDSAEQGWYNRESREAHAVGVLCTIVGQDYYFRDFMGGPKTIHYRGEMTAQLLALADAPPQSDWLTIHDTAQVAAWFHFAKIYLPQRPIRLRAPCKLPWPWPPKADGNAYDAPADPLADEQVAALRRG